MTRKTNWYAQGLNFSCTECGKCCTGAPGYVWVNAREMEAMATTLNLSLSDFKKRYTRRVGNRYSLLESKKTYDCVFLKEGKCTVYQARPTQCRTYPWWPENIASKEAWEHTAKECEGITPDAEVVPFKKIEEQKLIQVAHNEETR